MKFEHILEEIKETIVRVITNKDNVQDFNDIVETLSKEVIFMGRTERDTQVPISLIDTLYIESGEQMKSYVMTRNQGYCKLEGNLVQIEKRLLGQQVICRINRNTLVNIKRVAGALLISNMKVAVDMEDGSKHIVSRRYQRDFMERIKEYYGKAF